MTGDDASRQLEFYRRQCDELGGRVLRLQEEVTRARRDAHRNRSLALVVQALYRFAEDGDAAGGTLEDVLLMSIVDRLQVDAAALVRWAPDGSLCRVSHGIGLAAGLPLPHQPLIPGPATADELLHAAGLGSGLWSASSDFRCGLLLGDRTPRAGAARRLESADQELVDAALSVYVGLLAKTEARRELRRVRERLELALEGAEIGLYDFNLATGALVVDERYRRILGVEAGQAPLTWDDWLDRIHPEDRPMVLRVVDEARSGRRRRIEMEYRMRKASGDWVWVLDRGKGFDWDANGQPRRAAGTCVDVTERKLTEASIHRLAFYDPLTDLPNRRLFLDRLVNAQAASQRGGQYGAVLFIDLDHFKHINDARGHEAGDHLLREAAARLSPILRAEDTVSRFGGDEFVVLLPNLTTSADEAPRFANGVGEKVREALSAPYRLPGGEFVIGASVGVTIFRGSDASAHDILREADTALYRAKATGRNCVRHFEADMQAAVAERFDLEAELRRAIDREQLRVFLQPQVDTQGYAVGVEALLRWEHPVKGLIPPVTFIPLAEETGLIVSIGQWVLNEACRLQARLAAAGRAMRMSVNVSPRQFHQPDFVDAVRAALVDSGIAPSALVLEITEGLIIDDMHGVVAKMNELKALGVLISIDDFGTGYSSLSYLKTLPIDELKIDRSFVRDALRDSNDAALIEAMLAVSRHLKLVVVAEGVETLGQHKFLKSRGCSNFQGYFYGRPLPASQFIDELLLQGPIPLADCARPTAFDTQL